MAESVTVCQIKPMREKDVSPYNFLLDDYLRALGIPGCLTQIRMEDLRSDGFHIIRQVDSVIDRTYACALMRVPVPCPTPLQNFVPLHIKRRYQKEWPLPGGRTGRFEGQHGSHGWC